MPLINCKVKLSLEWIENCVLTTAATDADVNATGADIATFKITDAKLYVPIVTVPIIKIIRRRIQKVCLLEQI